MVSFTLEARPPALSFINVKFYIQFQKLWHHSSEMNIINILLL